MHARPARRRCVLNPAPSTPCRPCVRSTLSTAGFIELASTLLRDVEAMVAEQLAEIQAAEVRARLGPGKAREARVEAPGVLCPAAIRP